MNFQTEDIDIKPFDSFGLVTNTLKYVGYYKISENNSALVKFLHNLYRFLVFSFVIFYNVQHIIFIVNTTDDNRAVWDSLMIEIPQLILIAKITTIIINSKRIENLHDVINHPIFSARNAKDKEYLKKNKVEAFRMVKIVFVSVTCGSILWMLSLFFKRLDNPSAEVASYFPFSTTSWTGFTLSVLLEVVPCVWVGVGHLAIDCVIATYYCQATVQLKILKYSLEHIFDTDLVAPNNFKEVVGCSRSIQPFEYKDIKNKEINNHFIFFVEKYSKIIWYVKEVDNIFDKGISFQFFTTSLSTCLAIYNMTVMNVFSLTFMFMVALIILYQMQVFMYCFYGHMVQFESQAVNSAMYSSDWVSVSPRFRRHILIAMSRWNYPLTPRVFAVVPVSLDTFVSIIRTAYTLYTVMKTTNLN